MTPVSVDSALQRAHKAIEQGVPTHKQQATLRALGDSKLRQLVNRFAEAWERNDVDAVVRSHPGRRRIRRTRPTSALAAGVRIVPPALPGLVQNFVDAVLAPYDVIEDNASEAAALSTHAHHVGESVAAVEATREPPCGTKNTEIL